MRRLLLHLAVVTLVVLVGTTGRATAVEPLQSVALVIPTAAVSCSNSFSSWSAAGGCWSFSVQSCGLLSGCTAEQRFTPTSNFGGTSEVNQVITLTSVALAQGQAGTLRFAGSAEASVGSSGSSSLVLECWNSANGLLNSVTASTTAATTLSTLVACPSNTASLRFRMGFTTTWTTSSYEFNYPTISLSGAPNAPASVSSSSVLATSTTLSWTWTNSAPSSQPFGSFDGKVCTGSGLTGTCTSFSSTSASLSTAISALSVGTTYYVGVRACGSSVSSATCSAFTTTTFQTQGVRYVTTYSECSACNSTAALLTQTCVTATTSTPTAMVDCQAQPSPASSRSCNPVSDWSLGQCTQDESTSDHGESHCTQSRTRSYTSPDAITNTTSCPLTDTTSCKCGGPNVGTTRASQVSLSKSTTPSSHADVRQTTASATVTLATSGDRLTRSSATPSMPDAASTSVPDAASTPVPDAASTSVALGSVVTSVPGAAVSSPVVAATSTNPESTVASAAISSHTPGVSTALPGEGAPDPSGASSSMSLIGPVVGAVLGVLLLVIVILVVARRRRRQRQSKRSVSSIELMSPRSPRNGVATTDDHIQMMPNELTAPASKKNNTRSKQDDLYATTQDVAWESLYSTTQDVAGDGGLYSSAQDAANHGTYAEVSKSQLADAMKAGPSGEQYATPTSSASVAIGPLGDEYSLVNKSKKSSSAHLVNIGPRGDQYAVVNKTSKSSVSVVTSSDYEELSAAPSATIIGPAGDVYSRPLRGASSSPPEPLYSSPNDQIAAPFDTSGSAVYDRPSDV